VRDGSRRELSLRRSRVGTAPSGSSRAISVNLSHGRTRWRPGPGLRIAVPGTSRPGVCGRHGARRFRAALSGVVRRAVAASAGFNLLADVSRTFCRRSCRSRWVTVRFASTPTAVRRVGSRDSSYGRRGGSLPPAAGLALTGGASCVSAKSRSVAEKLAVGLPSLVSAVVCAGGEKNHSVRLVRRVVDSALAVVGRDALH
jgi:hypothetical protein